MWTKPWSLVEGYLIASGLIIAGLMLELSVGPVVWDAFAWPINIIVLAFLLLIVIGMHLFRKKIYAFRFLSSNQAAIPALSVAVVLTIIMGLTRQTLDGQWINNMLTFWPFVLTYVYMTVVLGMTILKRLSCLKSWRSDLPFMLNHLGLFIVLTTATLGSADMKRLRMITVTGEPEWRAFNQQGNIVELPLAINLKHFIMETYDDGSPKRFTSDIQVLTQSGKNIQATVDVNKPIEVDGWKIYQYGYDTQMGAMSDTSILELVSDPWISIVYIGIYMMLGGALLMFVFGGRRERV